MYNRRQGLGSHPTVNYEEAKRAIREIFLEIVERDPFDPNHYDERAEGYAKQLVGKSLARIAETIDRIRTELLSSQEYLDLQRRKAGVGPSLSAGLPFELDSGMIPYALGGVFLLLLLRR